MNITCSFNVLLDVTRDHKNCEFYENYDNYDFRSFRIKKWAEMKGSTRLTLSNSLTGHQVERTLGEHRR